MSENNAKDLHHQDEKMGKLTNREDFIFVEIKVLTEITERPTFF
jgi:hypothetical protein